jgi:hypothetical protein
MVRLTVGNLVAVTALAIVGIYAFKAITRMFPVRGLSDLAGGI